MRKWSPEAFTAFEAEIGPCFEPLHTDGAEGVAVSETFVTGAPSPSGQEETGPSPREVELQDRLDELERSHREETARLGEAFERRLESLGAELEKRQRREAQRLADEATGLALIIAEKIVRDRVEFDRGVLVRNLETTLFKVQAERPVTVLLNPEDAAWFTDDHELRDRLRIGAVVPDRRVEQGGCRIRTDDGEWDATLRQQFSTLADLVQGSLMSATETGETDEPA